MKKNLFIVLIILVLFVFSGCTKKQTDSYKESENKEDIKIESINEAFKLNDKIVCEYKINNDKAIISIDGNKYKVETDMENEKYYTIYDEKYFYSWTSVTKNGFKIEKSCYDELYDKYLKEDIKSQENLNEESSEYLGEVDEGVQSQEDFDNAYDIKCKHTNIIDLNLPNDINFSDYCQVIKDTIKIFETIEKSLNNFDF